MSLDEVGDMKKHSQIPSVKGQFEKHNQISHTYESPPCV